MERSRARAAAKKQKETAALEPVDSGASRKRPRAEGAEAKEAPEQKKKQRPDRTKGEAKKAARPRGAAQAVEGTPQKNGSASMSATTATPRQKTMLVRSRARLDLEQKGSPPAPVSKAVQNYRELCAKKPFKVSEIADGKKSFTLQPSGETGSSIGVILTTGSFYVGKVELPENLPGHVVTLLPKSDKKGGMSLGWKKFKNVNEACFVGIYT